MEKFIRAYSFVWNFLLSLLLFQNEINIIEFSLREVNATLLLQKLQNCARVKVESEIDIS